MRPPVQEMSSQRRLHQLLEHIGFPYTGGERLNELRGAEEASTAPAPASAIDVGSGLAALDERPTRLLNDQKVQEFIRSCVPTHTCPLCFVAAGAHADVRTF